MGTFDQFMENPIERALRLANEAKAKGLIGNYAIGGAFAFIHYGEAFETKDFDLMVELALGQGGLIDLGPVWQHFVSGGATPEGQFLRISRILVDLVPPTDALDVEALKEALEIHVGKQPTRVLTAEHAVAIAVRTGRPKDKMKIARLFESAPEAVDSTRLADILARHGLLKKWERLQAALREVDE